ncbi:SNF2-related protein [Microbacterium gorillae]|uniref:SNF2-related protein n=1 Tax=Microbacterium gorillae TaxID=1231063 RepID=UPI003D97C6FD
MTTPALLTVTSGTATLSGTFREPRLELSIHPRIPHPVDRSMLMVDWVKSVGSRWDPSTQTWTVFGLNSLTPSAVLADAGVILDWENRPADFAAVQTLDELAVPIAKLSQNGRTVMVRHRLAGYDLTKTLIGSGAVWDKDRRLFHTHVGDVLKGGLVRGGVHWPQDAIDRAYELAAHVPVDPNLASLAAYLGSAVNLDGIPPEHLAMIGTLPADGRPLFPYQQAGTLAVAAGRTCLFDEPGVGKTATAAAAARVRGAERIIIVCPPLLNTNWANELALAGVVNDPSEVFVFRPGRKEPKLPDKGVVVIADSMLASRPETAARLGEWRADFMAYDEAHRSKTIGSARGEAVLNLGITVKHAPVAITGTPLFGSPHELIPLLELTRMLVPVFGGRAQFLDDFCKQDQFGGWHAKKAALPRLRALLKAHVWVRRRKREVLPQLPPKRRMEMLIDVPLTEYRKAHKDVIAKVQAWVTWFEDHYKRLPDISEQENYAKTSGFELVSQLRRAAGLAKLHALGDVITEHIQATGIEETPEGRTYNRPLIVWGHHLDVLHPIADMVAEKLGSVAMIVGSTTDNERDQIVKLFQAGRIPVLVAGITKAGVGLTLTRSSDALFAELSWVPAEVLQAEDRCILEGQMVQTLRGPVPIEDVEVGDRVLTHLGNWQRVTDKWSRPAKSRTRDKLITTVKSRSSSEQLVCTSDHEVWTRRRGAVGWVQAGDLRPGDEVCTPVPKGSGLPRINIGAEHRRWAAADVADRSCRTCESPALARGLCPLHYRRWVRTYRAENGPEAVLPPYDRAPNGRYVSMPEFIDLDLPMMEFLGWYLAEGFSSVLGGKGSFVSLAFHEDERAIASRIADFLSSRFGISSTTRSVPGSRGIELRAYGYELASWLKAQFGHGARHKALPEWFSDLDVDQARAFFEAYVQGDGYERPNHRGGTPIVYWSSASRSLRDQVALIASRLGYRVSTRSAGARSHQVILGHETSSVVQWIGEASRVDVAEGRAIWKLVTEVSTRFAKHGERVWDLTVEGDASYVVGFVAVHNCHRVGTTNPALYTSLIAKGTLDEPIQKVLIRKTAVLEAALGNTDDSVAVMAESDTSGLQEIMLAVIDQAIKSRQR